MTKFAESTIEETAFEWLQELGYTYAFGSEIAFDGEAPERGDYQETLLVARSPQTGTTIHPISRKRHPSLSYSR